MNTMQKILGHSAIFLKKNSSTILTVVGAAGVVCTVITAVKATPKALKLIEEATQSKGERLTTVETVKAAGKCYIPSAILCVTTMACLFSANVLNQRHQAALVSAYALLDNSYKTYRKKVTELYGENADMYVKDEIAKDNYVIQNVSKPDDDKILFYDLISETYFEATEKQVMDAAYKINRAIAMSGYATLSEYHTLLGVQTGDMHEGEYLGWTYDYLLEWGGEVWLDFEEHKITMDDGLEAIEIYPVIEPSITYMDEYLDIPKDIAISATVCNGNILSSDSN